MGTCTYTLTTICNPDPTLPAFSVEVKKEEKENSKVSSIGSITIHVDNITVTAVRSENGMVRVSKNHHHSQIPSNFTEFHYNYVFSNDLEGLFLNNSRICWCAGNPCIEHFMSS